MPVLLVQSGQAAMPSFSASLPVVATAGNLLVSVFGRNDNASPPSVSTPGWTRAAGNAYCNAHPSFGGRSALWYKVASGGEQTVTYGPQQGKVIIAEFTGFGSNLAEIVGARAEANSISGTAISLETTPGVPAFVIGGVANRLNNAGSTLTADLGTFRVPTGSLPFGGGNNIPALLWRESLDGALVSLDATQGGGTQDGYWWGMQIAAFALPLGGADTWLPPMDAVSL